MKRRAARARDALALLLVLGASSAAASGSSDAPPCSASVELVPANPFVDQQVLHRVVILTRDEVRSVEWLAPPDFPGFRAERLPGRPQAGRALRWGASYRVREEHHALFPERSGERVIPASGLRCTTPGGVHQIPLSAAALRVRPLPEAGRPPGFSGLVGLIAVSRRVAPRSLALGGSFTLSVTLQGHGNLWDATDPLANTEALDDAQIFPRRPALELDRGLRLGVRRRFAYDVVPRREGTLALPALQIPYFDPEAGRYGVASAPPVEIEVTPRAATPAGADGATRSQARPAATEPARGASHWIWSVPAAALLAGAALWLGLRRRAGRHVRDASLAEAAAARARGDVDAEASALARALRVALEPHAPGAGGLAPEELSAGRALAPAAQRAAQLLAAAERARFDPGAPPPDAAAIERAIADLATGSAR